MRKMFVFYLILNILWGCNMNQSQSGKKQQKIEIDKSITKQTSFNNLFIDSNTINDFLSKHPSYQKFQQQYTDFYKQRNNKSAWFDSNGITKQPFNFFTLL